MLISARKIKQLSLQVRQIVNGHNIDLRDNREGTLSVLRDDIHALARLKGGQVDILQRDQEILKDALADISHQLKTPLTSAMVMVDLLETAPVEKQVEFIQSIKTSLQRTEWLTTTLLNMAKLETGTIQFKKDNVSSSELIQQALEPLGIQIELKELSIKTEGDISLCCDIRWTAEALTNVVKNAIEHSPKGSTISIQSGKNAFCTWISVADEGKGISKAQAARVFQRFEGSGTGAGYGIGLPLALTIMRGQNGDVEIENSDTKTGTIIYLKFYKA